MANLLVLGVGPYPTEKGVPVSGPTIRLRQFVEPLAAAGHEVAVVMLEPRVREAVAIKHLARAAALTPREILEPHRVLRAVDTPPIDAIFGVGSMMPVAAAARLAVHIQKPLWVDYFGDPLAEFHAAVTRPGVKFDIVLRDHIWKFVREGLNSGDMFSAVSDRQRDAVLGQLHLLGRASEDPSPHRRVVTIPCGVPVAWTHDPFEPAFPDALVEEGLDPDTPYIFIGGNWTPWLDEAMMGEVLARVLAAEPNCDLVIRAGTTDPLAQAIRQSFFAALGENAPAGRVHELDPARCGEAELLAYASATLLIDRDIPESHLGSRNRLLSFVRWGLHPVVSARSEIARDLIAAGLALAPAEDTAGAYAALLRQSLHDRAGRFIELQRRGLAFLRGLTFESTIRPAAEWAALPEKWGRSPEDPSLVERWCIGGME